MEASGTQPMSFSDRLEALLAEKRRERDAARANLKAKTSESESQPKPQSQSRQESAAAPASVPRAKNHENTPPPVVISSSSSSAEDGEIKGDIPHNRPNPVSNPSAVSLALNSIPIRKRKRDNVAKSPSDPIPCTCAISNDCRRKARDGVSDCRMKSMQPPIPKRQNKTRTLNTGPSRFISTKERARLQRSADEVLQLFTIFTRLTTTTTATAADAERTRLYKQMRDCLHKLQFFPMDTALPSLPQRFLNNATGLPAIANSPQVPWDIKLDCEALLIRWRQGDFDTDLLRGINLQRNAKSFHRTMDPGYKFRKSSHVIGENGLRNGQWFPYQMAALRDGAHGEIEAGICGKSGVGAFSIILSSSGGRHSSYADIDEGDVIHYCGTRGKDGVPSTGTKHLIESYEKKSPIRVLRSAKLPPMDIYRPSHGLRYDGLYEIGSQEVLDVATVLYRFKLHRLPGQTPIRFRGDERRPTAKEVEELKRVQNLVAGAKLDS
ncbi:hypothetical protein FQN52_007632 [Onygenales sp. PD_12]|nr:hypothetical protein FQN52_007632 [Onygenales sp. PD_12]